MEKGHKKGFISKRRQEGLKTTRSIHLFHSGDVMSISVLRVMCYFKESFKTTRISTFITNSIILICSMLVLG